MSKPDKARHYTIARGSAMEFASHLELLERVVAMLTKLIDP